jgi:hypothetical protein
MFLSNKDNFRQCSYVQSGNSFFSCLKIMLLHNKVNYMCVCPQATANKCACCNQENSLAGTGDNAQTVMSGY